jgi:amino acid transporter
MSARALREGSASHPGEPHALRRDQLGVANIVFFIIAAASPLTVVIALFPLMVSYGNGYGMPGTFIAVGALVLLFAVGYVAMARHVTNAGAFYAYVTLGLGRAMGLGAASLAIFAYMSIEAALFGAFGFYLNELLSAQIGIDVPWWILAFVALGLCLALGVLGVHSGARLLGIFMSLETLMIVVLSAFSLFNGPNSVSHYSLTPFEPAAIFSGSFGVALMFAYSAFIGFEGSAIYSEEAKDPRRTVPRATYAAVLFMALLYASAGWLVVNSLGLQHTVDLANDQGGNFIFAVSDTLIGGDITVLYQVLIVTATLAASMAFHNNVSRYLFALGRNGLIWKPLGRTHGSRKTPHVAATAQTALIGVVVAVFAIVGADPFATLFAGAGGIGTIGVILSQAIAAVAILVFFRRSKVDRRIWNTLVAPALAAAGLIAVIVYSLGSLDILLGVTGTLSVALVSLNFVAILGGLLYALYLRIRDPELYERLDAALEEDAVELSPAAAAADPDEPLVARV